MTITQAVLILNTAYPSRPLSDDGVILYAKALEDINPVTLSVAVMNLIKTSRFMPSIAEIREEAIRISDAVNGREQVLNSSEAWDLVYRAATLKGYDSGLDTLPDSVRRIAKPFWRDVCYEPSRNLSIIRAQFRDAYNLAIEARKTQTRVQEAINDAPVLAEAQRKIQDNIKQLAEAKAVE